MEELTGKVAVVTGAASGIGRGLAERFAAEGMTVVLADVEEAALDVAVKELSERGARARGIPTDVSDESSVAYLAQEALEGFGAVHVVCNNAGVSGFMGAAWDMPVRAWEWVLGVNLWGVIHGIRSFLPILLDQNEGHIVNTASVGGFGCPAYVGPYAASKHAVVGLTLSLFHELEMKGSAVGVTLLCPGATRTNILECERNWPVRLGLVPSHSPDSVAQATLQGARTLLEQQGIDPSVLADAVVNAVRTRQFLIADNEYVEAALQSLSGLLKGENPTLPLLLAGLESGG
ncbi:MAG TPA: SDR family NAD(P)-dependent oxidoreductase [Acidimicrobiales bacterium]|nr:SDR family NAD(P)-dependent oxidoreductase [Acidimicrobiales bacterium]